MHPKKEYVVLFLEGLVDFNLIRHNMTQLSILHAVNKRKGRSSAVFERSCFGLRFVSLLFDRTEGLNTLTLKVFIAAVISSTALTCQLYIVF